MVRPRIISKNPSIAAPWAVLSTIGLADRSDGMSLLDAVLNVCEEGGGGDCGQ